MPTLQNITIKKSDGTTDVVYTAIAGASSGSPAVFRQENAALPIAARPTLLVSARDNGARTARRVDVNFRFPITRSDGNGGVTIVGHAPGTASFVAPQNQLAADIKEQAYQFCNLLAAALIKECMASGYAPTSA